MRIVFEYLRYQQGKHSADAVKSTNISVTICGTPAHVKWYSYHASSSVIVNDLNMIQRLHNDDSIKTSTIHRNTITKRGKRKQHRINNTETDANMQLTINSFRPLFPDKISSPFFCKIPDISLTAVKIRQFRIFLTKWSPCMMTNVLLPSFPFFTKLGVPGTSNH